jgi:hypothetical protein
LNSFGRIHLASARTISFLIIKCIAFKTWHTRHSRWRHIHGGDWIKEMKAWWFGGGKMEKNGMATCGKNLLNKLLNMTLHGHTNT